MGWDDAPPTADELGATPAAAPPAAASGGSWDATPPTADELGSFGGLMQNTGENLKRMVFAPGVPVPMAAPIAALGMGKMAKEGLYDIPKAAGQSSIGLLKGTAKALTSGKLPTDMEQEVRESPIIKKTAEMTEPIAKDPLGYAYKNPVDAAMLAGAAISPFFMEKPPPDVFAGVKKGVPPVEPPPAGPGATPPPGAGAAGAGAAEAHPLQELYDTLSQKYEPMAAKPGAIGGVGRYLKDEAQKLAGHDLGIQPRQIQSMGKGYSGLEKAERLFDYARDKGYLDVGLTDLARRDRIKAVLDTTGKRLDAVRDVASQRGVPPLPEIRQTLVSELTKTHGIDSAAEVENVLKHFDATAKTDPTFSGMADLATRLNARQTAVNKLGQNPGVTTDGANIISRINNNAIRSVLNPKEATLYTSDLDDYGAHMKLQQIDSAAGRRGLSARTNQRGFFGRAFQEFLDRAGYRIAGKMAHGIGKRIASNPEKFKTLPGTFEEFAHEAKGIYDDIAEGPEFKAHGGIVGEMDAYLTPKYGGKR